MATSTTRVWSECNLSEDPLVVQPEYPAARAPIRVLAPPISAAAEKRIALIARFRRAMENEMERIAVDKIVAAIVAARDEFYSRVEPLLDELAMRDVTPKLDTTLTLVSVVPS